ncbi:hypothetical protein T07_14498 [Trichinella nelsoni]|uniref:Uncharacterized protein n=1 Tax=Trichinella nelsoni TaxID=6336 RepID=A0A0V0SD47_9BILA|nr:hypothetical protein T07_14498 [Trichinella nelsoni]
MSAKEKLIDCSAANSTSGAVADFPTGYYFQRIPASTKISKKKTIQEKNAEIFLQTACQQTSQHGMEKRQFHKPRRLLWLIEKPYAGTRLLTSTAVVAATATTPTTTTTTDATTTTTTTSTTASA